MQQSARLSAGVWVQWLFGQCPNELLHFLSGASLSQQFIQRGIVLKSQSLSIMARFNEEGMNIEIGKIWNMQSVAKCSEDFPC